MPQNEPFKQFSFRLPAELVDRVELCAANMRNTGLEVTRADVVRLLLNHALTVTECRLDQLLKTDRRKVRRRRR
jgi:hypothetical protein